MLPSPLLKEIFGQLEERHYAAGDKLIVQGAAGDGLFILLSGTAQATRDGALLHRSCAAAAGCCTPLARLLPACGPGLPQGIKKKANISQEKPPFY